MSEDPQSQLSTHGQGPATDASNAPVFDPSKNVLDLVEAAIKRQDDLRAAEQAHLRDVLDIRAEIARMTAEHAKELRQAEANRIDAIRAVDVGAVQQAAAVQATQATTLAAQVATSAETLRTQVTAAATASTIALAAALEPVQKDIADLRRAQYEAQGQKAQTTDQRGGMSMVIAAISAVVALAAVVIAALPS